MKEIMLSLINNKTMNVLILLTLEVIKALIDRFYCKLAKYLIVILKARTKQKVPFMIHLPFEGSEITREINLEYFYGCNMTFLLTC